LLATRDANTAPSASDASALSRAEERLHLAVDYLRERAVVERMLKNYSSLRAAGSLSKMAHKP
jgi:hypothetical protein